MVQSNHSHAARLRAPNDVRIDCKAAKHSDGDRGTPPADLVHRTAGGVPPRSADCSSAATAARANKRRFVNLLQQLGGGVLQRIVIVETW